MRQEGALYICLCHGITDHQIRECVGQGACSLRDVRERLGVATSCGCCAVTVENVLREMLSEIGIVYDSAA